MMGERERLLDGIASMVEQGQRIGASPQDIASNVLDAILAAGFGDVAGVKAAAWDEGVATALNHAIRNDDGITLRLEHLDGRVWANPYRTTDANGAGE